MRSKVCIFDGCGQLYFVRANLQISDTDMKAICGLKWTKIILSWTRLIHSSNKMHLNINVNVSYS